MGSSVCVPVSLECVGSQSPLGTGDSTVGLGHGLVLRGIPNNGTWDRNSNYLFELLWGLNEYIHKKGLGQRLAHMNLQILAIFYSILFVKSKLLFLIF